MRRLTPLRYPGGKAALGPFFGELISKNRLLDCCYAEPYAGGFGVGIYLLLNEYVDSVLINDVDPAVCSFWRSVVFENAALCDLVKSTAISLEEREHQKEIYAQSSGVTELERGFAFFFLNRTNRSGILNGGAIGGKNQKSKWKIDARFNRSDLVRRIKRIGMYAGRIGVSNLDALEFLSPASLGTGRRELFLYLDPPYYEKGQHLYSNHYRDADHAQIAGVIAGIEHPWVVTYDNHPRIGQLYSAFHSRSYSLTYSARECRQGSEIMFFAPGLSALPQAEPF